MNGIAVVVVVLVILLVALSMVIVAIRRTKGSTKVALIMLKDYVEWTMVTWQTIVQVGKRTTGGPDVLRRLYMFIAVVELDSAVIAAPEVSWVADVPADNLSFVPVTRTSGARA